MMSGTPDPASSNPPESQGEPRRDAAGGDGPEDLDAILAAEQSTPGSGDGLSDSEADQFCARSQCTVVVLAGGVRSGKTTLLTAIYEQLNQQPFGEYLFAGSASLFGFEKRGHGWRQPSGMTAPMTERTGFTQPPWLHLVLRAPPSPPHQMLLADLSGEHFERLISGKRRPDAFPMLSRADHVSVVLDGRKLGDSRERLQERSRAEQLLQVLSASGVLVSTRVLNVVITKLDRYLRSASAGDLDELLSRLQETAGIPHPLLMFRTAAQPTSASFPIGHGVDALLAFWLTHPSYADSPSLIEPSRATAYARFGLR